LERCVALVDERLRFELGDVAREVQERHHHVDLFV
jgi:hypothetical protein